VVSAKDNKVKSNPAGNDVKKTIAQIRTFNRYYTGLMGVLNKHYLNSSLSLAEARILYEIHNNPLCTSKKIISILNIDRGYLSRILKQFYHKKIIAKKHSKDDARVIYLSLTVKGKKIFSRLNKAQDKLIYSLVDTLGVNEQKRLVGYMSKIKKMFEK
jgi:DNA-binding MarR family transcriptional regulator